LFATGGLLRVGGNSCRACAFQLHPGSIVSALYPFLYLYRHIISSNQPHTNYINPILLSTPLAFCLSALQPHTNQRHTQAAVGSPPLNTTPGFYILLYLLVYNNLIAIPIAQPTTREILCTHATHPLGRKERPHTPLHFGTACAQISEAETKFTHYIVGCTPVVCLALCTFMLTFSPSMRRVPMLPNAQVRTDLVPRVKSDKSEHRQLPTQPQLPFKAGHISIDQHLLNRCSVQAARLPQPLSFQWQRHMQQEQLLLHPPCQPLHPMHIGPGQLHTP